MFEHKWVPPAALAAFAAQILGLKKRLVTTNGCFDILHWGHIQYLQEAKTLGDLLLVGLNSDASVQRLKGPTRPLFPENIRARQMAALQVVDFVTVFTEDTPEAFLKLLKPQIHVKGGDYAGKEVPEKKLVESWGGQFRCLALVPGFSTTEILKKLK